MNHEGRGTPYNLKCWKLDTPTGTTHFYTCGRPGRENGPSGKVSDELVHRWVLGLPGPDTAVVSLLGRKPGGLSEFSYYSFCGGLDAPEERGERPTFQEWLDFHHNSLNILVCECPTLDYREPPISFRDMDKIKDVIFQLISMGRTVIVMDSGGVGRTGFVCENLPAENCSSGR